MNIEFHSHSYVSYDAFTTIKQYKKFFKKNPNFIIAITDHNEIKENPRSRSALMRVGEHV